MESVSIQELSKSLEDHTGSQIQVSHQLYLRTNPAKHTLAKEYARIPKSLVELFLKSHQKMRNDEANTIYQDKATAYRTDITRQMQNIRHDIQKLTNKWVLQLNEINYKVNTNYNNPVSVDVQIIAPQEREFYEIIEEMDYLLVILDNLWHAKEQSIEDKQRVTNQIVKGISGLGINAERKARGLVRLRSQIRSAETKTDTTQNIIENQVLEPA